MDLDKIKDVGFKYGFGNEGMPISEEIKTKKTGSVFTIKSIPDKDVEEYGSITGLVIEKRKKTKPKDYTGIFVKSPFLPHSNNLPKEKVVSELEEIPQGSHDGVRDARGIDISKIYLSRKELSNLIIDKTTILSERQKSQLQEPLENGKNPGLGVRALHAQGITGKGVKIAIIDQPLGAHKEYADRVMNYEEIGYEGSPGWLEEASMHGAAVTSIAAGKNIGVAPESGIVYIAALNITEKPDELNKIKEHLQKQIESRDVTETFKRFYKGDLDKIESQGYANQNKNYADAINKVLDMNKKLSPEEQIPVISISWGFNRNMPDYDTIEKAMARAKAEGVFVVSTAMMEFYKTEFNGASRNPSGNPDDPKEYGAGAFWAGHSTSIPRGIRNKMLLVPMDHRTVADYTDDNSYRYEGNDGGMSWAVPYLAGTYALVKQANPAVTPEQFLKEAFSTSDECKNSNGILVGRLINPQKLIEKLKP